MFNLIFTVSVGLLVFGSTQATHEKNCTEKGYMCVNCSTLALCVENDVEDTFLKHYVKTCEFPQKCVKDKCEDTIDPICDHIMHYPFICKDIGAFPHPFNFRKFIFCVPTYEGLRAYQMTCSNSNYFYNPKTTYCDLPAEKSVDERKFPIPVCNEAGKVAALPENPTIYYVCEEYSRLVSYLYPFQYLCPNGEIYNGFECNKDSNTSDSSELSKRHGTEDHSVIRNPPTATTISETTESAISSSKPPTSVKP